MTSTSERERHEKMIERACSAWGVSINDWSIDEEEGNRVKAHLGRWRPTDDTDMLNTEDEGELTALVVGAPEYGNERVEFMLEPEGIDRQAVYPADLEPAL